MLQTRTLDPADVDRALEIRNRSFGVLAAESRASYEAAMRKAIDAGTTIGAYEGDLLVGRALIWPFRQWWCGRNVAMAGVAGVVVAPDYRGRGVGGQLMDAIVERARELSFALATLYPATVPVYRQRGWEIAGAQYRFSVEARMIRDLRGAGDVTVRQAGPDDAELILDLMREMYAAGRDNGPKDDDIDDLREELADPGVFGYVAERGFVVYGWDHHDLAVHKIVAHDVETARALWAVVGSGSSVARTVHAALSPDDPIVHLLGDGIGNAAHVTRWMLRVLDARAAIAGRGFPAPVEVDVPIALDDAHVADNRFNGRLQVIGGKGELVDDEPVAGATQMAANGLAALYAGTPTTTLRAAGLLAHGDDASDAALDAAFAGRPAYLIETF